MLYLDESGHPHDPQSKYFVLAGFSVFERQTHWLEAHLDLIANRFSETAPRAFEFHGAVMQGGRDEWSGISPADRAQAVVDVLSLLLDPQMKLRVFSCVIEKALVPVDDILQRSFERIALEFDRLLGSMYYRNDPQRGLLIFDKSNYEARLQALSLSLKHGNLGTGTLRNFAEVPLFLDSKASRLIQMADMIAYWIFRYFESGDKRGFEIIERCIHNSPQPQLGHIRIVSPETEARLAALPPPTYPFPHATAADEMNTQKKSGRRPPTVTRVKYCDNHPQLHSDPPDLTP